MADLWFLKESIDELTAQQRIANLIATCSDDFPEWVFTKEEWPVVVERLRVECGFPAFPEESDGR
jgi:hypothetical protein